MKYPELYLRELRYISNYEEEYTSLGTTKPKSIVNSDTLEGGCGGATEEG